MKISLKKLLPKSSKEVYMEKVYGPNGLFNKQAYIIKVMKSCKTIDQLHSCNEWGKDIIWNDWNINRPHLPFKWQLEYDCIRRLILNSISSTYLDIACNV